jgi:uncharacterized membrane protein YidH (DUF202 family)
VPAKVRSGYVERTALSWRRTGLALLVVALAGVRVGDVIGTLAVVVMAGLAAGCAVWLLVESRLVTPDNPLEPRARLLALAAAASVCLALVGVILSVTST